MLIADPPVMKHAGDVVFADVNLPWELKALEAIALAWLYFAPILIAVIARRGRVLPAVCFYLGGSVVGALFSTFLSGDPMGEGLAYRTTVWARHIWLPWLGTTVVLCVIAAGLGRLSRRVWSVSPKP